MGYDTELWNKYTDDNKENIQNEFSKFIYFLSLGIGAKKICEAGCNIGNNLSGFPENFEIYGIDMNKNALEKATKPSEREHVTPYIYNNPDEFSLGWIENKENLSEFHWTIDRKEDLIFVQNIFKKISKRPILMKDIIDVIKNDPSLLEINKNTNPNEGYLKSIKEE